MAAKKNNGADVSVPEPREKRHTSFGYIMFSLFVTILGLGVAAAGALLYGQRQFEAAGPLQAEKTVVIKSGERSAQIAALLEDQSIISSQQIFYGASLIYQRLGVTLKAGEYHFEPGVSMQDVFDKISKGKALSYKVTIPEGWTSMQALERIRDHPVLTGSAPATLAEGILLPDTYTFQRGDTREAVIERMQKAQQKVLDKLWKERATDLPLKTIEEALILASIVEKETGVAAERPRVAAVFVNRLKRNMRLQSDPTIIYGIVGGKGKLGRPIKRSEIDKKTTYNTYQIDGLPPTPIANPGKEAIAAVLQPQKSEELYFVADGTGGHVFARTLAEHEKNVQRYRKIERKKRIAAAKADDLAAERAKPVTPSKPPATATEAPAAAASEAQTDSAVDTEPGEIPVASGQAAQSTEQPAGEINSSIARPVPLPRPKPAAN